MPENFSGETPRVYPDILQALQKFYDIDEHKFPQHRGGTYAYQGVIKSNGAPVEILIPHYDTVNDPDLRKRITGEFATLQTLGARHVQRVFELHKSGDFKRCPVLVVYAQDEAIAPDSFAVLPEPARNALYSDLLHGLAELHSAGIVHGNIGAAALSRVAKTGEGRLSAIALPSGAQRAIGPQSRPYLPSGRENADAATMADDIYALGMAGYRLFMGEAAFNQHFVGTDDPAMAELAWANRGTMAEAPEASALTLAGREAATLAVVLRRMTGRDPNLTYETAATALAALGGSSNPPPPPPETQKGKRPLALWLGGGVVVAGLAAAAAYLINDNLVDQDRLAALDTCAMHQEAARDLSQNADLAVADPITRIVEFIRGAGGAAPQDIRDRCVDLGTFVDLGLDEVTFRDTLATLTSQTDAARALIAAPPDATFEAASQAFDTQTKALGDVKTLLQIDDTAQSALADILGTTDVTTATEALVSDSRTAIATALDDVKALTQAHDLGDLILDDSLAAQRAALDSADSISTLAPVDAEAAALRIQAISAADTVARDATRAKYSEAQTRLNALPVDGIADVPPEALALPDLSATLITIGDDIANLSPETAAEDITARMAAWTSIGDGLTGLNTGLTHAEETLRTTLDTRLETLTASQTDLASALPDQHPDLLATSAHLDTARTEIAALAYTPADTALSEVAAAIAQGQTAAAARIRAADALTAADAALKATTIPFDWSAPAADLRDDAQTAFDAFSYPEAEAQAQDALTTLRQAEAKHARQAPREVRVGSTSTELSEAQRLCTAAALPPRTAANCAAALASETLRTETLTPFALDKTEVSAASYAAFVQAQGAGPSPRVVADERDGPIDVTAQGFRWDQPVGFGTTFQTNPDLPVLVVSAREAERFCAAQTPAKRLPTEAEWEYMARYPDTSQFAWVGATANALGTLLETGAGQIPGELAPVAAASAVNDRGLVGMAGNAREWVRAPDGFVLKGGSFRAHNPIELRIAARLVADGATAGVDYGFRCAMDVEEWED